MVDSRKQRLGDVVKPSKGDVVRAAVDGGLQAIPVGGGAASSMLALIWQYPFEKRRDTFVQDVADRVSALEDEGRLDLADLADNEAFATAVWQATRSALGTGSTEKREALRNAILNTALGLQPEDALFEMFMRYVDDFTPLHIKLLVLFDNPQQLAIEAGYEYQDAVSSARWRVVDDVYPELKDQKAICRQVWSELYDRGLVAADGLDGVVSSSGLAQHLTTEIGQRFVAFVSEPG